MSSNRQNELSGCIARPLHQVQEFPKSIVGLIRFDIVMQVKIRFYSVARELAGSYELSLHLSEGSTLSTALERLFSEMPALQSLKSSSLFAVGLDYAPQDTKLFEGDEISFIPPVQGG